MHKPNQPEVVEMGGLAIVGGFGVGVIAAIAMETFFESLLAVDSVALLAALATILIIALLGIFDDLIQMPQLIKAIMPLFAALPLVSIKAGDATMAIPLLGQVNFGIVYPLLLVPLGISGAANAVNMLAGFNGVEVGMGIVAASSLAVIAYLSGAMTSLVILLSALGALLAALYYNWYPAKVFIGDIGTLSIGAIIACSVIIGNFEGAGVIIIIPYAIDLIIKAKNRFPKSFGIYKDGKLFCPESGPVGLGQLVMKIFGGIHERTLVLVLMGLEAVFGLVAVLLYAW